MNFNKTKTRNGSEKSTQRQQKSSQCYRTNNFFPLLCLRRRWVCVCVLRICSFLGIYSFMFCLRVGFCVLQSDVMRATHKFIDDTRQDDEISSISSFFFSLLLDAFRSSIAYVVEIEWMCVYVRMWMRLSWFRSFSFCKKDGKTIQRITQVSKFSMVMFMHTL